MNKRFQVIPAVFIAVFKDQEVLLQQRQNTGWLDGWYDLPSGHLEPEETYKAGGVRELAEETGLVASEDDLRLFHVCQNYATPGRSYTFHFFEATDWSGEPAIQEPDKCSAMRFFGLNQLPEKTVPYVKQALGQIEVKDVTFSYYAVGSIENN